MAMTLSDTSQIADAHRATVVVYANPGVGKTALVKTLPPEQTVILNTEKRLGCLKNVNPPIATVTVDTFEEFEGALKWIKSVSRDKGWKYLFTDSISDTGETRLSELKIKYPNRKDSMPMFGELLEDMTRVCKFQRDMTDMSCILIGQPGKDKDFEGRTITGVDMAGKISQHLARFYDEVLALKFVMDANGNRARWLVTQDHDGWYAKDGSGTLDMFEPPDLMHILNKILFSVPNGPLAVTI